jgi:hypothetical protein
VGGKPAKIIVVNGGQAHVDKHSGGAQIGLAFCRQGCHVAGCRQGRVPLEHGDEIGVAQQPPTAGMSKNCRLVAGDAAGQEQGAQAIAQFLAANAGDNFAHNLTNGCLVSTPYLARFVYGFNHQVGSESELLGAPRCSME